VHFGDGVHGKAVPPGFRNVVAQSYQVGGGAAGAVAANKITNMVLSIPFVSGVTNPWPATGGEDAETQAEARLRGPSEIRSRGRAVAPADYEILALRVTGAQVSRAHAVSGFHPSFAGSAIPGVVCVFVVSNKRGPGPPIPDEDTLRAVSEALSNTLSPAGVEIVAAAPAFHNIRIEATVVLKRSVNRGEAVRDVLAELNSYLDPIKGGDDGQGWPFGGTLFHSAFVRRLLSKVSSVSAVPRLSFVVDGARRATCVDFPIPANSLVWPANHQVLALGPEEQS
jgi:predicted phage baseplate assembly protein